MAVPTVLTMMCLAGVTFYVRFLVALCQEWRIHRIFFWVRLHRPPSHQLILQPQNHKKPVARAA
jgi:hypothetical protein